MLEARSFHASVVIVVACFVCPASRLAADTLTRSDGERLERKVGIIQQNSFTEADQPRLTTVTEQEVNAYLKFQASDRIPAGITDAHVTIEGNSRLSARAAVDLDEARRDSPDRLLDLLSYLTGPVLILAIGLLHTSAGVGHLEVETVTVAGLPVPKALVSKLVRYYSRTPEDPEGVNLDAPFELPASIREVRVGKGEAVIVQ